MVALLVDFGEAGDLAATFEKLSRGGRVFMPLQAYPFSPRFAWLEDRYGVWWQLNLMPRRRRGRGRRYSPPSARARRARGTTNRMPERSSSIEHVLLSISPRRFAPGTRCIWLM